MSYIGTMINDSPTVVFPAAETIAGGFLAVELTAEGLKIAKSDKVPLGIVMPEQDETETGERVHVQVKDIGRWTSGGEVAVGDLLAADDNGKCVKAESGKFIVGIALEAATGEDIPILVQITKSGYAAAGE